MRISGNSRIALDTSAYAHLRVGHEQLLDLVARAETIAIPAVVLGELEAGFLLGSRLTENRKVLAEFLAEPEVRVVTADASVARRYGALFAALRRAGKPLPTNDIWIAACALETGARLVTFDRDFDRIGHLDCIVLA